MSLKPRKWHIKGIKASLTIKDTEDIINRLTKEMKEAALQLQFERAAELRDKINKFKSNLQ
jgi:excinuclease ABC subunit B